MIALGVLTLKSGFKYEVQIHEVKIFQLSVLLGGSFKLTEEIRSQLNKDASTAGTWQAVQEMSITFERNGVRYDSDIMVKEVFNEYPKFEVIKENVL